MIRAMPCYNYSPAVILALAVFVGGCTIRANDNEVVIEHPSVHIGIARKMADSHCGQFNKTARLVQASGEQSGFLGFRKKVSVFECVARGVK